MSNLEDIIKQKVEQFDVPFNEAHWEAMEAKLHALKIAKIKKNIFLAAGIVSIVGVISLFIYKSAPNTNLPVSQIKTTKTTTSIILDIKTENNTNTTSSVHEENNQTKNESYNSLKLNPENETTLKNNDNSNSIESIENISPNKTEVSNSITPQTISAEFIVYNNRICLGEEVTFEVVSKGNLDYLWDFGDGSISTIANPKHTYLTDGLYTVNLTVTDNKSGKSVYNEVKRAVEILPLPTASFNYKEEADKHDANKLKYPYTSFTVKDKSLDTYTWNFGNGQTATTSTPKIIFDKKGTFKTTLIVKNAYGCINSCSKIVSVDYPFNLFAPNAFSPNQDGDNDTFIPKALLAWDVQFEMVIKNKVGDVIFKSSDKHNGWNGKLNNTGINLEPGIYFWQVVTYDAEGTPHQHYGKLNLIK